MPKLVSYVTINCVINQPPVPPAAVTVHSLSPTDFIEYIGCRVKPLGVPHVHSLYFTFNFTVHSLYYIVLQCTRMHLSVRIRFYIEMSIPPLLDCTPLNEFAHYTATQRWPATIHTVINDNKEKLDQKSLQQLNQLIDACKPDTAITLSDLYEPSSHCNEFNHWNHIRTQYSTYTLLTTPWYIAESYLYHLILTACNYFTHPNDRYDPFAKQKQNELSDNNTWSLIESAIQLCNDSTDFNQTLAYLLELAVYGNRVDLSYRAVSDDQSNRLDSKLNGLIYSLQNEQSSIIINDTQQVIDYVNTHTPMNLHIIHDNSGTELLCDLVLIYYFLCNGCCDTITLHCKQYPTFVSDATKSDILHHIITMIKHNNPMIQQCGRVINKFLRSNSIIIRSHSYWNSSEFYDKISDELIDIFTHADLTIIKGDANYRRTVEDRLWSTDISIYDPLIKPAQLFPSTFLLLRTLKSDTIVGVSNTVKHQLDCQDRKWRVNGKRGVIQFHKHSNNDI